MAAKPTRPDHVDDSDPDAMGRPEIHREVAYMLGIEGKASTVVVGIVAEKYSMQERQVWRYVKAVRDNWAKIEIEERPGHRAHLVAVQMGILADARAEGDHRSANGAIKNLMDLFGLKSTQVELSGGLDSLVAAIKATPSQREDRIAELEAKAAAEGADLDASDSPRDPG